MILISACLAGISCRYNGTGSLVPELAALLDAGKAIAVCPEVLGGLPVPREPCEIRVSGGSPAVFGKDGGEFTQAFHRGAGKALRICQKYSIKNAVLKSRSPSCGCGRIYDGTFSGKIIEGNGVTAELLLENGIAVYTEENWKDMPGESGT